MKGFPEYKEELTGIFRAGVRRVDPEAMLLDQCSVEDGIFRVKLPGQEAEYRLSDYRRIMITGAGKATAKMAKAMETLLGDMISEGLIVVKYGHTEDLSIVKTIEAGHPVPDDNSVRAADALAKLAGSADEDTLIINLVSGGGSALLCLPYSGGGVSLTLAEKQETTRLLLECGAEIAEINTIRKHLSGIKGGRLAAVMYPADVLNLILSDVVGDRLDSIASGISVADGSSYADADRIIRKYGLETRLPGNIRKIISMGLSGEIAETPKEGDEVFSRVSNILIGTNLAALKSAEAEAVKLGYNTAVLSSQITGEASEAAKFYLGIGRDIARDLGMLSRPACIIAGGETTVTIKGRGKGGRNQEMALAFLDQLDAQPGIYFLSGGSDGNDGPTDAAGAFAAAELASAGSEAGLSIQGYLDNNDSYNYFRQTGGLLITGPTNTNVCDIQIMLVV